MPETDLIAVLEPSTKDLYLKMNWSNELQQLALDAAEEIVGHTLSSCIALLSNWHLCWPKTRCMILMRWISHRKLRPRRTVCLGRRGPWLRQVLLLELVTHAFEMR